MAGTHGAARTRENASIQNPSVAQMLLEQYKLLEERRKYFGNQFMQTIGGVAAIVSLSVGLISKDPANKPLLKGALIVGCCVFPARVLGFSNRCASRRLRARDSKGRGGPELFSDEHDPECDLPASNYRPDSHRWFLGRRRLYPNCRGCDYLVTRSRKVLC